MAGNAKGPLDGIPIGHKDIYNTAGIRTTGHSRLLEHNVPAQDATSVRKWAEAGVVLMGKLSTHEFAMGGPSFDLPWPPARNPWNPEHFTAGSSSGTGAAVASGMILGGTGSDTGGSIRGPAALCGIAGIKPTYGLVSRAGVLPLSFSMDHAGPMAWTVEDCALLLQAMAGHDPADPASADRPVADFTSDIAKGVKGLRIGVVRHFFETDNPVSPATLAGINHALDVFEHLGAEVSDVKLSPMADYHACGSIILIVRGVCDPRTVAEDAVQRLRRAVPRPAGAGRLHSRHRLCAGAAPPPHAVRGTESGDGAATISWCPPRRPARRRRSPRCRNGPRWRSRR